MAQKCFTYVIYLNLRVFRLISISLNRYSLLFAVAGFECVSIASFDLFLFFIRGAFSHDVDSVFARTIAVTLERIVVDLVYFPKLHSLRSRSPILNLPFICLPACNGRWGGCVALHEEVESWPRQFWIKTAKWHGILESCLSKTCAFLYIVLSTYCVLFSPF